MLDRYLDWATQYLSAILSALKQIFLGFFYGILQVAYGIYYGFINLFKVRYYVSLFDSYAFGTLEKVLAIATFVLTYVLVIAFFVALFFAVRRLVLFLQGKKVPKKHKRRKKDKKDKDDFLSKYF